MGNMNANASTNTNTNTATVGTLHNARFVFRDGDLYCRAGSVQPPYEVLTAVRQAMARTDGTKATGGTVQVTVAVATGGAFVVVGTFSPDGKSEAVKIAEVIKTSERG